VSRFRLLLAVLAVVLVIRVAHDWRAESSGNVVAVEPRSLPERRTPGPSAYLTRFNNSSAHDVTISAQTGPKSERELSNAIAWPVRPRNADHAVIDVFAPAEPLHPALPSISDLVLGAQSPIHPPPPPPPPPEPPKPPPLSYAVIGDWTEDGQTAVLLYGTGGARLARVGDLLDPNFRVQAVAPGKMTVLYVPMNQTQDVTWIARR
jgi:hypothetical protein